MAAAWVDMLHDDALMTFARLTQQSAKTFSGILVSLAYYLQAEYYAPMKHSDPEKSIGFLIYDVSRLMRRDFDARVQSLGFTTIQWRAIAHIARQEGCNQATLADQLEIKPITLTRLIDRLAVAGWVVRLPDPKDRRAVQLYLTATSRPLLATMQEKSLQTRTQALQGISEDEFAVLFSTLKTMKKNLSNQDA